MLNSKGGYRSFIERDVYRFFVRGMFNILAFQSTTSQAHLFDMGGAYWIP